MRLIHLSDIHFSGYTSKWEPNEDQRSELVRDLADLVADGGPVDGVLVGGDIAQSARADQYTDAADWLRKVSEVGKCPWAHVWVVPGNHDIDRDLHQAPPLRRYLHEVVRSALAASDFVKVDEILHDWFLADEHADGLLKSLESYNDFASELGCPTSADSPTWTDLTLDLNGLEVQLTGLNSVLVSDTSDVKAKPSLAIGRRQCEFERSDGRIHIVFAHHPPEWLGDWEAIKPYLLSRTHLVLFGHEHKYATEQPVHEGTVIIRAGAVGPQRGLRGPLVPSWNLITLTRNDSFVEVTIQPRIWSTEKTTFDAHPDGTKVMQVRIDLQAFGASGQPDVSSPTGTEETEELPVTSASPLIPSTQELAAGLTLPPAADRRRAREIAVSFLKLTRTRQRSIATELGVGAGLDALDARRVGSEILERVRHADLIYELVERIGDA